MFDSTRQNEIAKSAVRLWLGDAASLRLCGDANNLIYSFTQAGETRYLRIVSGESRTRKQIEAELDFVVYLYQNGVGK